MRECLYGVQDCICTTRSPDWDVRQTEPAPVSDSLKIEAIRRMNSTFSPGYINSEYVSAFQERHHPMTNAEKVELAAAAACVYFRGSGSSLARQADVLETVLDEHPEMSVDDGSKSLPMLLTEYIAAIEVFGPGRKYVEASRKYVEAIVR